MHFQKFFTLILLATVSAWTVWFYIVKMVNPYASDWLGLALFYWSLMLAILGSVLILGMAFRVFLKKKRVVEHAIIDSFRQSVFVSLLIFLVLVFLSQHMLTWWNFLILLIGLGLAELFFLLTQRKLLEEKENKHN